MSWSPVTFPMSGGLNVTDAAILVKPGEAINTQNFDAIEGGYKKCDGYAYFDGSVTPAVVPGSGSVLGQFYLNGLTYAFRNNAGGTEAKLFVSNAASWQAVALTAAMKFDNGLLKINEGVTINGAASGATALVKRVCLTDGDWSGTPAPQVGALVVTTVTGVFTVGENIRVGAVVHARVVTAPAVPVLAPSGKYQCIANNFGGAAGTTRIYGCDGQNPAFEFDGTIFAQIPSLMPVNKPHMIEAHSNYLWLAFTGGSLQRSAIGNPLSFLVSLGADQLATGAEIKTLNSYRGEVLVIGCDDRVLLLYGKTSATFQLKTLSSASGALFDSACEVSGGLFYVNAEGLQSLAAVQAYGDFAAATMSRKVKSLITASNVLFVYQSRNKAQVRVVMNDKSTLVFTVGTDGKVSCMRHVYPLQLSSVSVWRDLQGNDLILGGFTDGHVAVMDSGTSFGGTAIASVLRLAYVIGKKGNRSRLHRFELEIQAPLPFDFFTQTEFDYGAGRSEEFNLGAQGGGGIYDISLYDQSYYSGGLYPTASIEARGIGENMNLFIYHSSATDAAFTLSAATLYLSLKGPVR